MGNCFGSPAQDSPSTAGTSNYHSNTTGFSTTSSNARFFEAVGVEDVEPDGQILETPNLK
ncbi:hypothetical protein CRG98_022513, partial [Punica granatum]